MDRNIPIGHRLKLFGATVTPTILYGSGAWVMTGERRRQLRTTQRKMLRMIGNFNRKYIDEEKTLEDYVTWIQRATKEAGLLMKKYDIKDWTSQQRGRLWQWAGRVARCVDGRWSNEILHWELLENRPRGRPRIRWTHQFVPFLQEKLGKGIAEGEWITIAQDAARWDSWITEFSNCGAGPS